MSKKCGVSFLASVALLLLVPAVVAQQSAEKTSASSAAEGVSCGPQMCVSKVFYLPDFSTPHELQDVVNALRLIVDISHVNANPTENNVWLQGTTQQLAIAEQLVTVLESLKSSGNHNRSSVLVYEPLPVKPPEQSPVVAPERCELTNCFIKAMYLPDFSIGRLQEVVNILHFTGHVGRICMVPSSHAIVFQGTSKQLALADGLMNE
jgi:hypothetical protein